MSYAMWELCELINAQHAIYGARHYAREVINMLPASIFRHIHLHITICTPINGINTRSGNHVWHVVVRMNSRHGGPWRLLCVTPVAEFPDETFEAQLALLS